MNFVKQLVYFMIGKVMAYLIELPKQQARFIVFFKEKARSTNLPIMNNHVS